MTYLKLKQELSTLEKVFKEEKALNKDLTLQLLSSNDPTWIEQNLIRSLGVVPDGFEKVLFR